jgi:hypothetical protein
MQVQFKSTDGNANTHCCVCGQGFELSWERRPVSEVTKVLFEIQKKLCSHHRDQNGPQAHPPSGNAHSGVDSGHGYPGRFHHQRTAPCVIKPWSFGESAQKRKHTREKGRP